VGGDLERRIVIGKGTVVVAIPDIGDPAVMQGSNLDPRRHLPVLQQGGTCGNGAIQIRPGALVLICGGDQCVGHPDYEDQQR